MKRKIVLCLIFFNLIMVIGGCQKKETNLLHNPKDVDIKNAIETIVGVNSTCMVTEENDPNGNLNKEGWYTGAVYFRLSQVDVNNGRQEYPTTYADNACEAGTDGGGQIEIYANQKDAKKRNEYLANFDGTVLGNYHSLRGTLIIRLSNDLSASQQNELEEQIYKIFNETKVTNK